MTRHILARTTGSEGQVLCRLAQTDEVWEAAYDVVMTWPEVRRLRAFWRHYYGASAEMQFEGKALSALGEELRVVLADRDRLPRAARTFIRQFALLCRLAIRQGARIEVVAD
ncbi:hypothetical protein [Burkholderia sp. NLJ2]|uniref:hypothetical protein n=1 Tax=Burkholderia sp. NLJ2 TaxID=3090699 RepID=UPI003C6BF1E4